MQHDRDTQPWYRQFWPWFLIALPASAVVASLWTISVAIRSPNALVVDDYGKIGIATEKRQQRDDLAAALQLQASMQIYKAEGTDVIIMLRLSGNLADAPERLDLGLTHPTLQSLDRSIALHRIGNGYEGSTGPLETGRYYIQLEPPDRSWRLTGELSGATRELVLGADAG